MKQLLLSIFACLSFATAMAEDVIQVQPLETQAGLTTAQRSQSLKFNLCNEHDYTAFNLDLYLPAGMTLKTTNVFFSAARAPYEYDEIEQKNIFFHQLSITQKESSEAGENHYFLTCYDEGLRTFTGTEGLLFELLYMTSADMQPGIYPIRIEGAVLGIDGNHGTYPQNSVSYVKICSQPDNTVYDLGSDVMVPSFVQSTLDMEKNIKVNGVCDKLNLVDGADYVAGRSFTATSATYTAQVSDAGMRTLVLPYSCSIPTGFTAYEPTSVSDGELNMSSVGLITANKPVLLCKTTAGAGSAILQAEGVPVSANTANLSGTVLIGTYAKTYPPFHSYVLQTQAEGTAFYKVVDEQPAVRAFRAYLQGSESGARMMSLVLDGEVAGILNPVTGGMQHADAIYSVSGVKRSSVGRGLNIIRDGNGVKKVMGQ